MNQILSNETLLDQFDSFKSGKMSPELRNQFAQQINADPEMQQAYQIFLLSTEVIEQRISQDLKSQMQEWKVESDAQESSDSPAIKLPQSGRVVRLQWLRRVSVAASLLLLLSVGAIQYNNVKKFTDVAIGFNQGIDPPATRGDNNPSVVDMIMSDFINNVKTIDQTIGSLQQVSPDEPDNNYFIAQNYLGKLYLTQGKCEEMAKAYQISGTLTGYKYDEDIGKVLCALKNGSSSAEISTHLQKILVNTDHFYHKSAVKIDRKVNSIWWKLFN